MASLTETVRAMALKAYLPDGVELPGETVEPPEAYHRFLYWLVRDLQPEYCLELGVKTGTGVGHMLAATDDVKVVGVDIDYEAGGGLIDWVVNSERVKLVESDSLDFLNELVNRGRLQKFQVIHLDTVHESAHVDQELDLCRMVVRRPGLVCIDDIGLNSDMRAWWRDLKATHKDRCIDLPGLHITGYGCFLCE